jgi:hypothetical protein
MRNCTTLFSTLILATLSMTACDSGSTGSGASDLASLSGTLTLDGEWPQEGEIQVSLFSQWDTTVSMSLAPGGPPSFYTEALTSPTPQGMQHSVEWELRDITPGAYPCIVVGWRNGGTLGADEPVLGMFGGDFAMGDSLPEALGLSAGDDLELTFSGDLSLVPALDNLEPGSVRGSVSFPTLWPSGYGGGVYVVAMGSSDPATPSAPIAGAVYLVEETSDSFEFTLPLDTPFYLAVYGYPYDMETPFQDFFGAYGYDWQTAEPTMTVLELSSDTQETMENLSISCRDPE